MKVSFQLFKLNMYRGPKAQLLNIFVWLKNDFNYLFRKHVELDDKIDPLPLIRHNLAYGIEKQADGQLRWVLLFAVISKTKRVTRVKKWKSCRFDSKISCSSWSELLNRPIKQKYQKKGLNFRCILLIPLKYLPSHWQPLQRLLIFRQLTVQIFRCLVLVNNASDLTYPSKYSILLS